MSIAAALIGGAAALGGGLLSSWFGNQQNERNIEFQKKTNDTNWKRNMQLTLDQWQRDDTAVQRRVADLKAAGLSPVLAAGSAASTSQPIASTVSAPRSDFNAAEAFLSAVQQKANITQTNAGTELARFQAESERSKQALMSSQVAKTNEEALNLSKQNSIFDLDMMSKINLRGSQAQNLLRQSELLSAETIYKQTELDRLKTEIDIAKIKRDVDNFNLATSGIRLQNDVYRDSKGIFGKLFGDIRTPFVGFDINHARSNMDTSWYWDK